MELPLFELDFLRMRLLGTQHVRIVRVVAVVAVVVVYIMAVVVDIMVMVM